MEIPLPASLRLGSAYTPRYVTPATLTMTTLPTTSSYSITLPTSNAVGLLTNDGSGYLSWEDTATFENVAINANSGTLGLTIKYDTLYTRINIMPPATLAASKPNFTLTLPSDDGTASQFLQTDGSGTLTWATAGEFDSSLFAVYDATDDTKKIDFNVAGLTTATTRTITFPDSNIDLTGATTIPTDTTGRWEDLRVALNMVDLRGVSDPDFALFQDDGAGSTGIYIWAFDASVEEEVFFSIQFPHSYKLGSDIYPHLHIAVADNTSVASDASVVTFKLEYTWVDYEGAFSTTTTIRGTFDFWDGAAAKPLRTHYMLNFPAIDGSSISGLSSMMLCRLYRDPTDGDTFPNDVFVFEFDIHYEADTVGSTSAGSK